MKLKLLREHYRYKIGTRSWVPKRAFSSVAEVRACSNYNSKKNAVYKCKICGYLHISSYSIEPKEDT